MRIGEISALTGVTTKTIRYYESIGLLHEPQRTPSGYRDYAPEVVDRLTFIRDAQASGLSLAEVSSVLELKGSRTSSCEHTESLLRRHLDDVITQITRLQQTREQLTELLARAESLEHTECTDPHRCHVIAAAAGAPIRHRAGEE